MKFSTVCGVALAIADAAAFPSILESLEKRQVQGSGGALPLAPPPFNKTAQYVSNQGANMFIPPGPGDQRGQCPGLNAMANHGYLPRNGRATIQQFFDGTQKVFGMAPDLAGFLASYGAFVDGDGTSWSIGGVPRTGISGSRGNYETDSSPLHADLNQYGSLKLILSQYTTLRDMQPNDGTENYNLQVLRDFRGKRFQESIDENPYYAYLPFSGIAVSQAAFTFIYRFMSNKSAENPEGVLRRNVLKSFFSINGTDANPVWTPGYNRIPDNWYKRNDADQYSIPYFMSDIRYFGQTEPEIFNVGCNQGKVNTYNSISPEVLTSGAYTAASVAAAPLCYSSAFATYSASSLLGLSSSNAAKLQAALLKVGDSLGVKCPTVTNWNTTALRACPGFSVYGGPTGPVAPGAVQN